MMLLSNNLVTFFSTIPLLLSVFFTPPIIMSNILSKINSNLFKYSGWIASRLIYFYILNFCYSNISKFKRLIPPPENIVTKISNLQFLCPTCIYILYRYVHIIYPPITTSIYPKNRLNKIHIDNFPFYPEKISLRSFSMYTN